MSESPYAWRVNDFAPHISNILINKLPIYKTTPISNVKGKIEQTNKEN